MNLRNKLAFFIALNSYVELITRGTSPLSLPKSIANSLSYVKAFGGTEQRNIPQPYTQVNYVTNTAQTMINTGVKFDFSKNYEIELKVSGVTGSWYILQARENASAPISGVSGSMTGNQISLGLNGTYVQASQISRVIGHIYYIKGTINNGNVTLYVKDETAGTEETVTGTYTVTTGQSVDMGLFGNTGGNYVAINSDVYFARIKEDGNYIMDYVPAKQGTTAGFYDKASGTFKTALTPANLSADGNTVPTPTAPMDIVSNNGVLKVSGNLLNPNDSNYGNYTVNVDGTYNYADDRITTGFIPVIGGNTLTVSTNINVGSINGFQFAGIAEYDANKQYITRTYVNYQPTLSVKLNSNTAYVRVFEQFFDFGNVTPALFATYQQQLELGSTATPYTPYSPTGIYTDGEVETIADSANHTANVATLLGVGDYKDEQNINTGAITRNVGVKVLDGTENWNRTSSGRFYNSVSDIRSDVSDIDTIKCSHFKQGTRNAPQDGEIAFRLNSNGFILDWDTNATLEQFQQYLAEQYANGTPVIIVYPLATATTESVAGQTLQVTDGDNVLEITQASLDGLELEAKYKKRK